MKLRDGLVHPEIIKCKIFNCPKSALNANFQEDINNFNNYICILSSFTEQNGTPKDPYHYHYCVNIEVTKSRCSNVFNTKYATKSCHLSDSSENRQRHTRGMTDQDDKVLLSKNLYVLR